MMSTERIPKLDLTNWPADERAFVIRLASVLTARDPGRISEHVELARTAPSGIYDDWYLEQPALFSLLLYGKPGIDALLQLGLDDRYSGGFWVPHVFAVAAFTNETRAEDVLRYTQAYLEEEAYEQLLLQVRAVMRDEGIVESAKESLAALVHGLISDPFKRGRLGTMFTTLDFSAAAGGQAGASAATDLVLSAIARGTLRISESICNELELMIEQDLPEREYQQFFERNPALIDPLASSVVQRQPLGAEWKTDFVIRRLDDEYILVEIEKPQDSPFTAYPHPSVNLSHAIGQILNWFAWFEDNIAYARSHGFPGIHLPRGVVVIGRRTELAAQQSRMLRALSDNLHPRIQVVTYDDVLTIARNILRNLTDTN